MLAAAYPDEFLYNNYGAGGTAIPNYVLNSKYVGAGPSRATMLDIQTDDITLCIMGLNDLKGAGFGSANLTGCGPNPDYSSRLKSRAMYSATAFMVPLDARRKMLNAAESALNPDVAVTGSWTVGLGSYLNCAFTANGSATFTTAVGNLLIIRYATILNGTARFSVTIDGVAHDTISAAASYDTSWCPDCIIIPLDTTKAHTVVLTRTAGSMVLESVDCVDTSLVDFSATFGYATPNPLNDGVSPMGWNTGTTTANSATVAGVSGASAWLYGNGALSRFSATIHDAMNTLYEYGFNVFPVDITLGFDLNSMMNADTLHRNDNGHIHAHRPWRQVLDKMVGRT